MHQKNVSLTNRHPLSYLLLIVGILCALCASSPRAYADSMPGGTVSDPTVRAVDIAQPAVVRIITAIPAQLSVHVSSSKDVTFPQQSNGTYEIDLSGTGTFISSHGDILTADHVVSPPKNQELSSALYTRAAQDIANYLNTNQKGATSLTSDQVVQQLNSGQLKSTPTYQSPSSSVFLSTAYTGQTNAPDFKSLPTGVGVNADRIEKESPFDQQDTAIIHVPLTDTLSVPLSDSTNVHPQDKLTIIGFPGNADVSKAPDSLLTSSLNQIYVSSLKTNDKGAPLIQVGGNVEQGDSGGPALDNNGNIVGIVSFGRINTTGAQNGTSFLQASSSAQNMIKALNLDTKPGKQQTQWSQAFNTYAATSSGHWSQSQQDFANLQKTYPTFKAIQPFQTYAQQQAKNEHVVPTKTPTSTPVHTTSKTSVTWQAIALTVISVLVLLLLMGVLFMTALRMRPKGRQKKGAAAAPKQSAMASTTAAADKSQPDPVSNPGTTPASTPASNGSSPSRPAAGAQPVGQNTLSLKAWPCGHMNRPNARFCSICGEPAPEEV
ncbi:trypsin-like peptidase domain-containing protein [Dictyobacter aurantiacus]|uniref:Peptidase S1 domain-containing protein n=1 Tax=Dictyobacter aurantiacus TaxID=1936993 RepID=A0A401ZD82_9CHLR|nr:trypsin-like peptidase domain-containing protein [Dictyobacter aurantiacus]GCE04844.1 hypothetical protein KDAU_21730 [Dictyobacter aurantiacus]